MAGVLGTCSKIRHIVRLRQMLRRWRTRAACSAAVRWRRAMVPADVPAGHVAVSVGSNSRRFVVRAAHLNHPAFRRLLAQAEEEYGFATQPGPLSIPCDEAFFEEVLRHLNCPPAGSARCARPEDFQKKASLCRGSRQESSLPLLQGFLENSAAW